MATVGVRVLSRRGSVSGAAVPSTAEALPEWNSRVLLVGGAPPPAVHEVRPFSKPPLRTCAMLAEGVTWLDCGEAGAGAAGVGGVTVNVLVVAVVSPGTLAGGGGGVPVSGAGGGAAGPT